MTIKVEKLVLDHPAGGLPPHPHEYPLVGALPKPAGQPRPVLHDGHAGARRFGAPRPGVHLPVSGHLPEHIQQVLVENQENYWKGKVFNRARFLFGNGLVVNEGEGWRRQRRLMPPAFPHRRVAALVPVMVDVVGGGWPAGRPRARPESP